MATAGEFAVSLVLIVVAAELFTNAVEWAGYTLRLASGATGSLLAALGTALPETTVPIVAIVSRGPGSDSVAVGGILGAPFLLLTMGIGVTGLAVWLRRSIPILRLDPHQVRRDLTTFLVAFTLVLVAVPSPGWLRAVIAVALVAVYARYVHATLTGGSPVEEMPEPLHLTRGGRREGPPRLAVVGAQLLLAVAMLIGGADLFVRALEDIAHTINISALLLALVIVPLATEMPETLNSVLWVRSGDDRLAFGNVAGAVAFQACIPGAVGVAFTSWRPGRLGLVSAGITMAAGVYTLVLLHDGRARGARLMLSALPWVAFALVVFLGGSRLAGG